MTKSGSIALETVGLTRLGAEFMNMYCIAVLHDAMLSRKSTINIHRQSQSAENARFATSFATQPRFLDAIWKGEEA